MFVQLSELTPLTTCQSLGLFVFFFLMQLKHLMLYHADLPHSISMSHCQAVSQLLLIILQLFVQKHKFIVASSGLSSLTSTPRFCALSVKALLQAHLVLTRAI